MVKTLEITTKIGCPINCSVCPQKQLIRKYYSQSTIEYMSMDTFEKIIHKVPKDVRIDFSGMSEPWLNKHITDMILLSHKTKHRVAIYTTCVNMSLADIDKINHIPFDIFVIHLPDIFGNSIISLTKTYKNVIDKLLHSSIKNISTMAIGPVHSDIIKITGNIKNTTIHSRAGNIQGLDNFNINYPTTCNGDSRPERGVILPNGDVFLCCMDYGLTTKLGNLLIQEYKDLYNNELYNKIINGLSSGIPIGICKKCIYAERGKI